MSSRIYPHSGNSEAAANSEMGSDTFLHVRGDSTYIDDLRVPVNTLHGAVVVSPVASGRIISVDLSSARKSEGVAAVFTAEDIPGENQIGNIIQDEPLWTDEEVDFRGQPIALVVAETREQALKGAEAVNMEIEEAIPVTEPRDAFAKKMIIGRPRTFAIGECESAWDSCDVIVSGRADTGGQEHLYLETQGAVSIPGREGRLTIISSTQNPTHVQKICAGVLGVEMNRIEVEVTRLGGAFGGKEDQATVWACMTAVAATALERPVKLVLSRPEDLRSTGKRHPYTSDYKLGLKKDGTILCYEVTFYQNSGASADLSTAVLERTLFHANNSYYIPNLKATAVCCRTNLPPNTAFRGFGGPQSMFVIESAIVKAAAVMDMDPMEIQKKNLLQEGDLFHFGQKAKMCQASRCFDSMENRYALAEWKKEIESFNRENKWIKKGFAVMPVCFGISFTNTPMNQASSLVNVYMDGSVGVSTAGIEMGQGLKQKIVQTVSDVFSIPRHRVKLEPASTTRNINTSPTAASSGSDLNGRATEAACREILERLDEFARKKWGDAQPDWDELIREAYLARINLAAQALYGYPGVWFDSTVEKGEPFAYHVYGSAAFEVTVDCIRGTFSFDAAKIFHDGGKVYNKMIDIGQTEGALAQGLGWLTMEEVVFDGKGTLKAHMLSNYKVPDIYTAPGVVDIDFLPDSPNPTGLFNSKAIGEPPFMYAIGGYFALVSAIGAFRRERNPDDQWPADEELIEAPLTPEKVLLKLYPDSGFEG